LSKDLICPLSLFAMALCRVVTSAAKEWEPVLARASRCLCPCSPARVTVVEVCVLPGLAVSSCQRASRVSTPARELACRAGCRLCLTGSTNKVYYRFFIDKVPFCKKNLTRLINS
jgi:hypothetical protein